MLGFTAPPRAPGQGSGSAPAAMPLRTIVTNNRGNIGIESRPARNACVTRWVYVVAADASEIVISTNAFGITGGDTEFVVPNDFTILEQSLEYGGVVAPVPYGGGRSRLVLSGAVDVQSDPVPASAFGAAKFAKGDQIWVKSKISLAYDGALATTIEARSSIANQQVQWYDSAATTTTATDSTGAYTAATGVLDANRPAGYRPLVFGRPMTDGPSFIAVGDSIGQSTSDGSNPFPIHGAGFIQRAMRDTAGGSLLPCLNLARSASTSLAVSAGTRSKQLYKYARFGIDEYGTNDMSLATLQPRLSTIWSDMRAAGIEKIIRTKFLPRTSSTDNWATTANQTYNSDGKWQAGADADLMNTWFEAELSAGRIDYLIGMNSVSDLGVGGDRWKWIVNGAAQYVNADSTHPNGTGHELMAVELRPVLRSL